MPGPGVEPEILWFSFIFSSHWSSALDHSATTPPFWYSVPDKVLPHISEDSYAREKYNLGSIKKHHSELKMFFSLLSSQYGTIQEMSRERKSQRSSKLSWEHLLSTKFNIERDKFWANGIEWKKGKTRKEKVLLKRSLYSHSSDLGLSILFGLSNFCCNYWCHFLSLVAKTENSLKLFCAGQSWKKMKVECARKKRTKER